MAVDLQKLKDKFFTDPDWKMMEELLETYIEPMRDIMTVKTDRPDSEIVADVKGRQITYTQMDKFLRDSGVLKPRLVNTKPSFK